MSKNAKKGKLEVVETEGQEGAEGTTEAPAERGIILTLEDGSTKKRVDYIRERFQQDKVSRGDIAKELTKLQGKPVPYQIVFAATKGLKGGPDKVEAAPAAEEQA
jgi:hypothetical protein